MDTALRVMLVERNGCARHRLAAGICADARLLLADSFASGAQALERLAMVRPQVLLVGVQLADVDVVHFVRSAKRVLASCKIVVIAAPGEEQAAAASLAAGATGCMAKPNTVADLIAQLLQVKGGVYPMIPLVARLLAGGVRPPADRCAASVVLTGRESDVLRLIARGCTYSETAIRLGVSLHTVTTHIKNAYRKLQVHSAGAAVMRAMQLQLLGES